MKTDEVIAEQIIKKAVNTIKDEVIALSEEEFLELTRDTCPSDIWLNENDCQMPWEHHERWVCVECWKKATGRK